MEVGLVGQRGSERAETLTATLRDRIRDRGASVAVDPVTADALGIEGVDIDRFDETDLVVSVGGDGTFLYAARTAGATPMLGVNLGEVGFLNAIPPSEAVETVVDAVDALAADRLAITELPRLRAACADAVLKPAINEILVQGPRRGAGADARLTVDVDGERYASATADGVLVATPTGSTAYNLSEGGPIVAPTTDALIVTPMCPRDGSRPLVVPDTATVDLRVEHAETGFVVADGRQHRTLSPPTTVAVSVTDEPLRIAGPGVEFYEALEKLA